jgi:hypothetical protein
MATRKKTASVTKAAQKKGICFAIMPFGGWFDGYYSSIYQPAIKEAGLDPKRADDLYRPSTIVNDIWTYTRSAKLILADLTGKNPNVFYELGLAHALAKPAILVVETMNDVPFDLRALRVIEYDKNEPTWGESLKEKIVKSIREVVSAPLAAVLPAFLDVKQQAESKELSENEKEMIEMRQEIDLLRRELRSRGEIHKVSYLHSSDEAEALLRRFLTMGMPRQVILREMIDRGAPADWVERRMDEMLGSPPLRRKLPSPGSPRNKMKPKKVTKAKPSHS